jgi:hypothetical protein
MDSKTQEFLQRLKDSGNWNDDYDYSDSKYISNRLVIRVRDKTTNTFHLIRPGVLLRGNGLSIKNAENKTEYLKVQMIEVHGVKHVALKTHQTKVPLDNLVKPSHSNDLSIYNSKKY